MASFSSSTLLLRRWISSSSQILRSRALTTAAAAAPPPWLMLWRRRDRDYNLVFRFQCCESTTIYSFFSRLSPAMVVGSSHGWLAMRHYNSSDMFLSDPIVARRAELPPLDGLHRIVLSEREAGRAFAISGGNRRLAFCSPARSSDWTPFAADDGGYESIVYSTTHRRLLCLTSTFRLEAWDVDREHPSLDWSAQFEIPEHLHRPGLTSLIYLVCWEESGELFVVVRHMDPDPGRDRYVMAGAVPQYVHPTVDFEVYRVDREGGRVARMESSLGGLAMFVGRNHPLAIRGAADAVLPDAIYFAYDKRDGDGDDDRDFGIFDYQKKCISPRGSHCVNPVSKSIWFTPHIHHTI